MKITAYYCVSFINVTFTYKKNAMSHEISHENNHRICSTSETMQSTRYRPAASWSSPFLMSPISSFERVVRTIQVYNSLLTIQVWFVEKHNVQEIGPIVISCRNLCGHKSPRGGLGTPMIETRRGVACDKNTRGHSVSDASIKASRFWAYTSSLNT